MRERSQAGVAYKWIRAQALPTPSYILGTPAYVEGLHGPRAQWPLRRAHHGGSWNTVNRAADLAGNPKLQDGRAPSPGPPLLPIMPSHDASARDCVGQVVL